MSRKRLSTIVWAVVTLTLAFATFFPIPWMVLTSLKTENEAIAFPPAGVIVPLFVLFRDLGLLAAHLGPILALTRMKLPLGVSL